MKWWSNCGPQLGTSKRRVRTNFWGPILDFFLLKPVLRGLQERPRAIPRLLFSALKVPRALQEASKRLSEGFRVEDAIRIPFVIYF